MAASGPSSDSIQVKKAIQTGSGGLDVLTGNVIHSNLFSNVRGRSLSASGLDKYVSVRSDPHFEGFFKAQVYETESAYMAETTSGWNIGVGVPGIFSASIGEQKRRESSFDNFRSQFFCQVSKKYRYVHMRKKLCTDHNSIYSCAYFGHNRCTTHITK